MNTMRDFFGWIRFHADWIPLMITLTTATGQLLFSLLPLLLLALHAVFTAVF
jgi:hypothetical protein